MFVYNNKDPFITKNIIIAKTDLFHPLKLLPTKYISIQFYAKQQTQTRK